MQPPRFLTLVVVAAFAALTSAVRGGTVPPGWVEYGAGPKRASHVAATPSLSPRRSFVLPLPGRITSQVLAARGFFYAATSSGAVVAFDGSGQVRWRVELGQLAHSCAQLDGYGVTGTGVIAPSSRTLYLVDAFGRLHALALSTGAERPRWPVRVFSDYHRQLAWGALSLVDGSVYVPTASYCDEPMVGGMYRVELASKHVTQWVSVPASLGGGGGVWGWGGSAYSAQQKALYVVTANAFSGGANVGAAFSESAGYGEHLVELAPDLSVTAANHPSDLKQPLDLDFVGSPVVLERAGCGELVVAANKNETVYAWRAADIAAGPVWALQLQPFDTAIPLLSQLAWSPSLSSLYAATGTQLVRIVVAADCSAGVAWKHPLVTSEENGSPTIAGDALWLARNGHPTLVGYDARTGKLLGQKRLAGTTVVGPTVVGGRLVVGTMTGFVEGFRFGPAVAEAGGSAPPARAPESWVGRRYAWQSRSSGVYATDNGGNSWRRIYAGPALAVLRLSRMTGVIELGSQPRACMCVTRKLWTADGGKTWHPTGALSDQFTGAGSTVYWWAKGSLHRIAGFPPTAARSASDSQVVASIRDGTIVVAKLIPGGVAALVSSRVGGHHWDTTPRVVIVRGRAKRTVRLPARTGEILAQRLQVSWPRLTVTGTDFGSDPVKPVIWTSTDGGTRWNAD